MQSTHLSRRSSWQRSFAVTVVLALLLALPELHHHEVHSKGSAPPSACHLDTVEPAHHEACGLCAKSVSSDRLERPQAALDGEPIAEPISEHRQILSPGPPGLPGAPRAPPIA